MLHESPRQILIAYFLIILSVFRTSISHAQFAYPISLHERVEHSSLIIEGAVINQHSFWDINHRMIHTCSQVMILKVFKGNSHISVIDIINEGGILGDSAIMVSDIANLSIGLKGVFFLNPDRIALKYPNGIVQNPYELVYSAQGLISYNVITQTAADLFTNYGDIQNGLYRQIIHQTGHNYLVTQDIQVPNSAMAIQSPIITGFSPSSVRAGAILDSTNNMLTIYGTNLGSASGSAAVVFKNADNGGSGTISISYNSPYIVSWSNSQIVIKVPTGAGTGVVSIMDNTGNTSSSAVSLIVEFNIMSLSHSIPSVHVFQPKLLNTNGAGGTTIHYSSNTSNGGADFSTSAEKITYERALDTWVKTAGYNISIGSTTNNQVVDGFDGVNTIMWDNTATGRAPLSNGVLGVTYVAFSTCTDGNWYVVGFDQVFHHTGVSGNSPAINWNAGPCPPSSNEVDFETIALHELGHSMTLGHIIEPYSSGDPAAVMNFAASLGKLRRSPDFSALRAGQYALSYSSQYYGSCIGAPNAEMTPLITQLPANDDCTVTVHLIHTPSGTYPISLYYSTSNKNMDPSTVQMNCGGTAIGKFNSSYFPYLTGSSSSTINLNISNYTSIVDYSSCSGMGIKMTIFQVSNCPGSTWPNAILCQDIMGNGALPPISGLSNNTNYLFVFEGLQNTKSKFDLSISQSTLPVHLINFSVQAYEGHAALGWETTTEFNNKGFYVERSLNGYDFLQIGFVSGKGNTLQKSSYSFTDPSYISKVQQYRLRQVDVDGRFEFSNIVTIRGQPELQPVVVYVVNPVSNELILKLNKQINKDFQLRIFDNSGRLLMSKKMQPAVDGWTRIYVGNILGSSRNFILHLTGDDWTLIRELIRE